MELVGIAEIAAMLGVSRQRVHAIIRAKPDFPEPVAELTAGKIWLKADVESWLAQSGRPDAGRRRGS